MARVFAIHFCSVCISKYGCAHSYAHICRACTNSVYTLILDVCLSHTHILFQGFVAGSHPSFCLPHTLALRNTRLISNSFLEPLHSNYQRRAGEKASSRDQRGTLSLLVHLGIFQIKGKTISSWHIINYTCRGFPLGRSSDTLENKSLD